MSDTVIDWDALGFADLLGGSNGGGLIGAKEFLKGQPILEAFKLFGNGELDRSTEGRTEVLGRCVVSGHEDRVPSMCMNTDKNVWTCYSCADKGGDIFAMAAEHYDIPDTYQSRENFPWLLEQMLVAFGEDVEAYRRINVVVTQGEQPPSDWQPEPEDVKSPEELVADDFQDLFEKTSTLDWESIVETMPGSFIAHWMEAVSVLDVPNEYLFWNGLLQVASVIGRRAWITDEAIFPSLNIVYMGETGIGKTRSTKPMESVIESLYEGTYGASHKVDVKGTPASGEIFTDYFRPEGMEPEGIRKSVLLITDELSTFLVGKSRQGSTLQTSFMQLADSANKVGTASRSYGDNPAIEPHLCSVFGSQPEAIGKIMNDFDADSGFLNRLIFAGGVAKRPHKLKERKAPKLGPLVDILSLVNDWAESFMVANGGEAVAISDEAGDLWDEHNLKYRRRMAAKDGNVFARFPNHTLRIALVLTANQRTLEVDATTMRNAIAIMESCSLISGQVAEAVGSDENQSFQDAVQKYVVKHRKKHDRWPTRTEISRSFSGKKRNTSKIGQAITWLVRNSILKEETATGGNGKPIRTFAMAE